MTTKMDIEILEDGTISVTTGDVDDTVHVQADELLDELSEELGGERTTQKREHTFWQNRTVKRGGKIIRKAQTKA